MTTTQATWTPSQAAEAEQAHEYTEQAARAARGLFEGQQAMRRALPEIDFGQMLKRFLQDTLQAATADHWTRMADVFESCRPHPDDYRGRASAEALAEQDRRNAATAQACRDHAAVLRDRWSA